MSSTSPSAQKRSGWSTLWDWLDQNILALGREMRLAYLPPLMVYVAAGISGLTGIVGTFFVKEYLGLSAEFMAALGFWVGLPWALKMPIGHLVDLIWKWKATLIYLGASLISASLLIMIGLLTEPQQMRAVMSAEAWFILSALLAPIGYVLQDVVADAMTTEAVPRYDQHGVRVDEDQRRQMHITMQTLGRVAIIGGGVMISVLNVGLLQGVNLLPEAVKISAYARIYEFALMIPVVSILGVAFAYHLRRRDGRRLAAQGHSAAQIEQMLSPQTERPPVNWSILGGGLAFALVSIGVGVAQIPAAKEIVFAVSMLIVVFMMLRLVRELEPEARNTLLGTALVIFIFRATPGPGAGATWWYIDQLQFDQSFLATLSLIGSVLTLAGLFIFRRFMAEKSITTIVCYLTIIGAILSLPTIGMYYGLHVWTAQMTGGVVDARFIAVIDTALESPLGQIAMVPMLAWIARSAPDNLKATYFAVMASFTNLALSAAQLGTQYLNQIYIVTREVRDPVSKAVKVAADYSQLGDLFIASTALTLILPLCVIVFVKTTRFRAA